MTNLILKPGMEFSALSLWQPWASLIAMGEKHYETRGWYPRKHQPQYLAIHAAKRWTGAEQAFHRTFMRRFPHMQWPESLPLGAVLCICQLHSIHHTETIRDQLLPQERTFGDYSDGRYAWELEVLHVFEQPIPAQGAQLFWTWMYPGAK